MNIPTISLREQAAADLVILEARRRAERECEIAERKAQQEAEEAEQRAWKALSKAEKQAIERGKEAGRLEKVCADFEKLIAEIADGRAFTISSEGEDSIAEVDGLKLICSVFRPDYYDDDEHGSVGASLMLTCPKCKRKWSTEMTIYVRAHIAEQLEIYEGRDCYDCERAVWRDEQRAKREAKKAAKQQQPHAGCAGLRINTESRGKP
jgi:DNA repair exonuclease SbcCD ATPase subunit